MKTISLTLAIIAILIGGCDNPAKVSISLLPAYPCKGDDVTIFYELENLDEVEVWDAHNNIVLPRTNSNSGNFTIDNINMDMLPLKAKGTQDGESDIKYIGPTHDYMLNVIDDEIETQEFDLQQKDVEVETVDTGATDGCCCEDSYSTGRVCQYTFPILKVYETLKGKRELIYEGLFASRSKVTKLHNRSNVRLNIEIGGRSYVINSNQYIDVSSDDLKPGGLIIAKFDDNNYLKYPVGLLAATGVKNDCCQEGWVATYPPFDRKVKIAFSLICNMDN